MIDEHNKHIAEDLVYPHIIRRDLNGAWIGIGAAIEWIAMRGRALTKDAYYRLEDEAAEALVALLADIPPEEAEAVVWGIREDDVDQVVHVPATTWRQVSTSDANDNGKTYRLLIADGETEWDGALLGPRVNGFRGLRIRSKFIIKYWPEHTMDVTPRIQKAGVAPANIRRSIETIISRAPPDLAPLTQKEIVDLVRALIPDATRQPILDVFREVAPNSKRGPVGPRDAARKEKIEKLRREIRPA